MSTTPDQASTSELVTTTMDQAPESHVARLHGAVIGPVSTDYYLPVLARLDSRDQAIPIWNWAACLCTLNWMVFRGLWIPALLYVGAVLGAAMVVLAVTQLATPVAASIQWSLWAGAVTLVLLVPGFFGNSWLYAVYRKRLASALSATASVQEACVLLTRQASSRPRLVWITLANLGLAGLLLASWLALPPRHRQGPVDGEVASAIAAESRAAAPKPPGADLAEAASGATSVDAPANAAGSTMAASAASASAPAQVPALTPALKPDLAPAATAEQAAPASSESLAASAPALAASDISTSPASSAAASAPAGHSAVAPAPASITLAVPEMRRSTRFGETPRAPRALAPRIAVTDATPTPAAENKSATRFLINVGLFAQDDNARRVQTRLSEAGLPVLTQELQRASGSLTRVRVGPFASRSDADDAALKIRALQLDAVVVRQ